VFKCSSCFNLALYFTMTIVPQQNVTDVSEKPDASVTSTPKIKVAGP
jgi:hypothetical protein